MDCVCLIIRVEVRENEVEMTSSHSTILHEKKECNKETPRTLKATESNPIISALIAAVICPVQKYCIFIP